MIVGRSNIFINYYHLSSSNFSEDSKNPNSARGHTLNIALPLIKPEGTDPKLLESVELRALSPSNQTCPLGT